MDLKTIADSMTDFIKRYKGVKDVYTDKDGLSILSDAARIFDMEIKFELTDKKDNEK